MARSAVLLRNRFLASIMQAIAYNRAGLRCSNCTQSDRAALGRCMADWGPGDHLHRAARRVDKTWKCLVGDAP